MRLKGKVALVTGSSRGIGRAVALGLAREGARVAVNYVRKQEAAEEVVEVINREGGQAIAIQANVAKVDEIKKMVKTTCNAFGKIDILVNNAAIVCPALAIDTKEEDWDALIDVNLKGSFFCSQIVAKVMIKQNKGGRIINVSSINAQRSEPYYASYTASKGGLESLTRTLASELGPYGITVNAIAPGSVFTSLSTYLKSEEAIRAKERKIPIGKIAQPEDIAPAAIFFASEEAWYITGQILHVDGGSFINANREVNWVLNKQLKDQKNEKNC